MKSFDTELAKYAEKTRLKAMERNDLRERILTYMEYHPLPKELQSEVKVGKTLWNPARTAAIVAAVRDFSTTTYARAGAGAFAVFLMIVSVPFVAEKSVPGDVLYPIKTNINETILGQFANSPYEKVTFETELMERRISEARLLKKEGKLTDEVEASIAEDVKSHAQAAQESITMLKANDADEGAIAEIAFSTALEIQTAVLGGVSTGVATMMMAKSSDVATAEVETPGKGNDIAHVVREAKAMVDATKSVDTPSYERLMARTRIETKRAYEFFGAIKKEVSEEERLAVERRLGDIERKISEAENIHTVSVSGDGAVELVEVLADTRKLISFMTDIDVRESVTIEELVPIVLTIEERMNAATTTLNDVEKRLTALTERSASSTNAELTLQVEEGETELNALFEQASTSRAVGDVTQLEIIAQDALMIIDRLEAAFTTSAVDEEPEVEVSIEGDMLDTVSEIESELQVNVQRIMRW